MHIEKYFFHADTEKYSRAVKKILVIVLVPVLALCTFCTVNIVLNLGSDFVRLLIGIIMAGVLFGILFTFAAVYIADRLRRRHARYTFLDIVPSGIVYSEYAGEFTRYGERMILRRLYYVPFSELSEVVGYSKNAPRDIILKGKIRSYFLESDRLGYHINENDELEFDSTVLNLALFEEKSELTISNRLGRTKRIEDSIRYYWERFKSIPPKKPFDISDFVAERKRVKPKTSNPALEAPSFSRKWQ